MNQNLERIIEEIVEKNEILLKIKKKEQLDHLMGIAMKELRGKVSGEIVNNLTFKKYQKTIRK